jgi:hypothetical protein
MFTLHQFELKIAVTTVTERQRYPFGHTRSYGASAVEKAVELLIDLLFGAFE